MNYQIKVQEHLDPHLAAWFGDLTLTPTPEGSTLLTGVLVDQAALYGAIARCRDLGLSLVSVNPISMEQTS